MRGMNIKTVKVSELKPNPKNPRSISDDALSGLAASIQKFGLVEPIIMNETTGYIVGGHQRLKALEKQGIKETTVVVVNLSEKEEMELNVALNNKAIQGDWTKDIENILSGLKVDFPEDFETLKFDSLLEEIKDIDFDIPKEEKEYQGNCDEDEVPEVETKEPITKKGDLWELGRSIFCPKCGKRHFI